ncbi:MAG: hypothetical protein HY820_30400 [Acidobacteria bacterium]|nr:hypothetical protein [Acidobacteriota bacterium]
MRITPTENTGWFVRATSWFTRKGIEQTTGKAVLPDSTRAASHHPSLMFGVTMVELGQLRMRRVPQKLKVLASLATARRIGCPF